MVEVPTINVLDKDGTAREIATITKLITQIGLSTDAAATETDTTAVTVISILKQLSVSLQALQALISGSELQVDVVSSGLPTGAATAANQSTANSALSAIQTAIEAVQAAIEGTLTISGTVNLGAVDNAVLDAIAASLAATLTVEGTVTADHSTTGLGHGVTTVTTAGTDVALASSTAAKWVTIQAQTDNTGFIAVGASGVDATVATGSGVLLAAGESITLPVDNLADVSIDSTVSGEGVRYTYGT